MRKVSSEELNEMLEKHELWLKERKEVSVPI